MGHGVTFGSRSKWLETVLLGGTGWVSGGLAGFGALLIFDPSHSKIFFLYILHICWGSVGGLWVMTARAEISLYITCMHGVNTGLRGPAAIGHSQKFWVRPDPTLYISFIYIGGSKPLWWMMTAFAELSLDMVCTHGTDTVSGGLACSGSLSLFDPPAPLNP